jgi:hypothetical protein
MPHFFTRHRLVLPAFAVLALICAGAGAHAEGSLGFIAPSGSPSGSVSTPVLADTMQSPSAEYAAVRWAARATGGNLPDGCATIDKQRLCVPTVTVDGQRVPDISILSGLLGQPRAGTPAESSRSSAAADPAVQHAVSQAVLGRLLVIQAQADGSAASLAEGRAAALRQLAMYQQIVKTDPQVAAQMVPPGLSADTWFHSDEAARDYQGTLTAGNELRIIEGAAAADPTAHTAEIRASRASFLIREIPKHAVAVNGKVPTFSLTTAFGAP